MPAQQAPSTHTTSMQERAEGWYDRIKQPYMQGDIAPINLGNSGRLEKLLRAGKLYLSLQDVIALALENNLDVELQRYTPRIAETDLLRAQSGSAIRGAAGGVSSLTTTAAQGLTPIGALSTGSQGFVQNLDPSLTGNLLWGHFTTPQTSLFTTGTNSLVTGRKTGNFGFTQGFATGTNVNLNFNNGFISQNANRNDYNPSSSVTLELQVTQHLLQGFGRAVNSRNIRIARNNIQVSDLYFKAQIINTVVGVSNLYWDTVSFTEDVKVKRQALALSQKLYEDNKKQVEIGTLAPIEIIRAEAEVAARQQDLTISETQLLQQETVLKNALSKTGLASPSLAEARVIPTDQIRLPDKEPIEPMQDMVGRAMDARPEIEQSRINIENAKIGLKGSRAALLPTVDAFVDLRNNSLAGELNSLPVLSTIPGVPPSFRAPGSVDPFFLGGYGKALGQVFGRNFPDYSVGVTLNIPLRNRAAQADMTRDQLNVRQSELRLQIQLNQVRVEVQNALIGTQQGRARYQAAYKSRILQEQTLDAEQKKYALGASTIYFVIQAQRDLATAQGAEVAAMATYSRARVEMDRATGQTISINNIVVEEAVKGSISKAPSPLPVVQQ